MDEKDNVNQKKGVGLRVFGIILSFLGMLNIMFSLKAEIEIQMLYIVILVVGIILVVFGSWQNRNSQNN